MPLEWTDWSLPSGRNDLLALDKLVTTAGLVRDLGERQKENGKKGVDA